MSDLLIEELRSHINAPHRDAVVVIGAGVSHAASKSPRALWTGLLEHGLEYCRGLNFTTEQEVEYLKGLLRVAKNLDISILVAEYICRKLGAPGRGDYANWLHLSVGSLEISDHEVLSALRELKVPLLTTNYDPLIEKEIGKSAVPLTWRASEEKIKMVLNRKDRKSVLHLHGYWEEPETIVLSRCDYCRLRNDDYAQAIIRFLGWMGTLVFVGCGEGLGDPNFSEFRKFARDAFARTKLRHYRLALESEAESLQSQHHPDEKIFVIPYGKKRTDLPRFLRDLVQQPTARTRAVASTRRQTPTQR